MTRIFLGDVTGLWPIYNRSLVYTRIYALTSCLQLLAITFPVRFKWLHFRYSQRGLHAAIICFENSLQILLHLTRVPSTRKCVRECSILSASGGGVGVTCIWLHIYTRYGLIGVSCYRWPVKVVDISSEERWFSGWVKTRGRDLIAARSAPEINATKLRRKAREGGKQSVDIRSRRAICKQEEKSEDS